MTDASPTFTRAPIGWLLIYLALLAMFFALEAYGSLQLLQLLRWFLLVSVLCFATGIAFVRSARAGRTGESLCIFASPAVAAMIAIGFYEIGITPGAARFLLTRSTYLEQVARTPRKADQPLFMTFEWDNASGFTYSESAFFRRGNTLVYDESDQMALPYAQRSARWKASHAEDEFFDPLTQALGGHFFLTMR